MTRGSARALVPGKAILGVEFAGGEKPVISAPNFTDSEEKIRVLLRTHLPHGTKSKLAFLAGIHVNQLSRQLSGDDGLHDKTVNAAIAILRDHENLFAIIAAIHILRNGGQVELVEKTGLLIQFTAGQFCLPGMGNR